MIDALKDDVLVKKVGGAFRLTALVQRRMKELIEGARPLVETEGKTIIEIAVTEIQEDKIAIDYSKSIGLLEEPGVNENSTEPSIRPSR